MRERKKENRGKEEIGQSIFSIHASINGRYICTDYYKESRVEIHLLRCTIFYQSTAHITV